MSLGDSSILHLAACGLAAMGPPIISYLASCTLCRTVLNSYFMLKVIRHAYFKGLLKIKYLKFGFPILITEFQSNSCTSLFFLFRNFCRLPPLAYCICSYIFDVVQNNVTLISLVNRFLSGTGPIWDRRH